MAITHLTITVQTLLNRRHIRRCHDTLNVSSSKVLRPIGKIRQINIVSEM